MLLELQKGIIYGPINSRRLGSSLGINILPSGKKLCTFNCVYCQYGWSKVYNPQESCNFGFPSVKAVRKALKKALIALPMTSAYITFSGNGEPTLHPEFGQIVDEVISLRNKLAPEAKTAVLSNSALVTDSTVRKTLAKLDLRVMKLDCGSPEIFKKYNKPCKDINLEDITDGLAKLSDVTIQTLISSGKSGNFNSKNIITWIERLKCFKPLSVQLYTLDRGYPAKDIEPASKDELNLIKDQVQKAGISVEIF